MRANRRGNTCTGAVSPLNASAVRGWGITHIPVLIQPLSGESPMGALTGCGSPAESSSRGSLNTRYGNSTSVEETEISSVTSNAPLSEEGSHARGSTSRYRGVPTICTMPVLFWRGTPPYLSRANWMPLQRCNQEEVILPPLLPLGPP